MSAPKPRPSAWDWRDPETGFRVAVAYDRQPYLPEHGENPLDSTYEARWGHEWAAVAWMAAAVEVGDDLLEASE